MTPTSLRRRTVPGRVVVASMLVVASLAACGGGSGGAGSSSSSSASDSGSASPDSTGSGGGSGGGGDDGFAYLPWGPTDPPIPDEYRVLSASSGTTAECTGGAQDGDFWAVAVAVCKAVTSGGEWPTATSVPAPPTPDPPNPYEDCLNGELSTMLTAALAWHANNPGGQPKVSFPASSTISSCQSQVYEVSILSDSESSISGENQVPVSVVYSGTGNADGVTVDGQAPENFGGFADSRDGLQILEVLVPLQADPRTAQIQFTSSRGTLTASIEVPGDGGSGSTSSESPTDDTSTEPSTDGSDQSTDASTP